MPANPEYEIVSTQPWTYIGEAGNLINGYRVTFRILAYNEVHFVEVPTLDKSIVDPKVGAVVSKRKALGS